MSKWIAKFLAVHPDSLPDRPDSMEGNPHFSPASLDSGSDTPDTMELPIHDGIHMEPATKPDGSALSSIYWEASDGRIMGPALPEFFLRDGNAYWISVTFRGQVRFIREDRLRSKKAFETQRPMQEIERIQDPS